VWSVHNYNAGNSQSNNAFKQIIELSMFSAGLVTPEQIVERSESSMVDFDLISSVQSDELEAMGIRVFDEHAPDYRILKTYDAEGLINYPASLAMVIHDTGMFTDTVSNLQPNDDNLELTNIAVNTLLNVSAAIVREAYGSSLNGKTELQRDVQKLADIHIGMFVGIGGMLAAKGMDGGFGYTQLSEYIARNVGGTLPDYLGAEEHGYLNGPDQYGPASWQRDITPENLLMRWQRAQDYLLSIRDREEPSIFYSELFDKLRTDFDVSMGWIANRSEQNAGLWSLREPLQKINDAWNDKFSLENCFYHAERAEKGLVPITFNSNDKQPKPTTLDTTSENKWWER